MVRAAPLIASLLICCVTPSVAQNKLAIGLFTGATSSFTIDQGMSADSRYKPKYDLKIIPIGVSYSVDYKGHGFDVSPSVMSIGRNYHFVNIFGEQTGVRKTSLTYFHLPFAYKFHLI